MNVLSPVVDLGLLGGGIWSTVMVRFARRKIFGGAMPTSGTLVFLEKKEVMEPQRVALGFFLLLMVYTAQLIANHDSTAGC